jgi:plastocyanin
MRNSRLTLVLVVLVVSLFGLVAWGCGSSATTTTASPQSSGTTTSSSTLSGTGGATIVMKNTTFDPATITVKVGDTVTWENQDAVGHNVVANDGSFKSPTFGQGGTFAFTFTKAGTYPYVCSIHPGMSGTVVVQ